jgi:ribokinase
MIETQLGPLDELSLRALRREELAMLTVFGSINVDLTFQLPHLPRVGETVLTPSLSRTVGGKGANQAAAAARDGAETRFIGCVGEDAFGTMARAALVDIGVDVTLLQTTAETTGLAAVWVDAEGRNQIAVASGANGALRAAVFVAAAAVTNEHVVLQMETPADEVAAVIAAAKRRGAIVILNLAPALPLPAAALRAVDVLVLNEEEAAAACGALGCPREGAQEQLAVLAAELGTTIIITLGAAGAIGAAGSARWQAPALPVVAVDSTGAGDCFVGVLAAGMLRGLALPAAMRRAAVAGSLACTIVGAMPSFPACASIEAALAGAAQL